MIIIKEKEKDILLKLANNQISKEEAKIEIKKLYHKKQNKCTNTNNVKNIQEVISKILQDKLHISLNDIDYNMSFKDMGIDSISGVEVITEINSRLKLNLDKVILYEQTNINMLSQYISEIETSGDTEIYNECEEEIKESIKFAPEIEENISTKNISTKNINNNYVLKKIKKIISDLLHYPIDEIDNSVSFKDLGIDSISGVEIVNVINKEFNLNLDKVILYDYPNIKLLVEYICNQYNKNNMAINELNELKEEESFVDNTLYNEEKNNIEDKEVNSIKLNSNGKIILKDIEDNIDYFHSKRESGKIKLKEINFIPVLEEVKNDNDNSKDIKTSIKMNKSINSKNVENVDRSSDIAVIGMSGRFPGANNVREFWKNLKNGICSVEEIPEFRWNIDSYYDEKPRTFGKTYCKYGGYLEDVDKFDPLFFNISPREAEFMDPQQRIFLEESWKAIEDAGYTIEMLNNEKCGVFVGATYSDYGQLISKSGLNCTSEAFTGLAPSILASRISYYLNLTGPSITIDTACSSSLVAINQACNSIINNESNIALAGGIMLMLTPDLLIKTSDSGMVSASGKCSTFDNSADGTVFSEGAGVVLLKSLEKAIEDNDYIYGVIRGSIVNQDGKTNGITAPSLSSQAQLEEDLYRKIHINPETISYVEAHGTGTKLGDPIEVKALTKAFRKFTNKNSFCGIGSVKTNIGHTTMASGVISLIKVLLSMKYNLIPPSLHYSVPNEHINFEETPFYVVSEPKEWKREGNNVRRAAISSFGFSGTNCHMIVDEYIKS